MQSEQLQDKKKRAKAWPVLRVYGKAAGKYPWVFFSVFLGGLIIEVAGVIAPLFLRRFIDTVSGATPTASVIHALFLTILAFLGVNFVGWIGQRIRMGSLVSIEINAMRDLYAEAFSNLLKHSQDFFSSNFAGTLTRRVSRYSQSFENILDIFTFSFLSTAIFSVGALFVLFQRSHLLALALLAWIVLFIFVQVKMAAWKRPLRAARTAADSKVTGTLSDAISNQSTVTFFASQKHEQNVFAEAVDAWEAATKKSWSADQWIFGVQGLFAIAIESGLLAAAVLLWSHGLFSVGDFVLLQVYVLGLIERLWNIGNNMRRLNDSFSDAYEMVEIMETPFGVKDKEGAGTLSVTEGTIAFADVQFQFSEERSILEKLSLTIPAGQKVALVGHSGAGKSTVTKLILRLYDVTSGIISIDGQDIAGVTQESLRQAIGFVPQEPILFHRTLRENIRYGRQDATDEEVIEAAKKAHCHEFISKLADGYETYVGERGVKLSGGERQRVAIARAILKNAPILVLDEATSSLDSESEAYIQESLATLMEGKTVIVIAHRLSTIMRMDRIIVLEQGAVVADGTHDELLAEGGIYQKLWSIQAGSFATDS